jgi:hypothetical protein
MKKLTILIALAAVVCFSVPAMAVDWNFYGSARMATFYKSTNEKDVGDKFTDLQWDLQGNSRLGANVKADHIKGQVELGLNGTRNGGGSGTDSLTSDGADGSVTTRRIYGTWNFGAGSLKVGKDYTPVSKFVSAQAFDGDAGLIGYGAPYGGRPGQIALSFGGFDLALVTPKIDANLEDPETGTDANGQAKRIIPKIEASWGMAFDAWNFDLFGGYQYYSIKNVDSLTNPGDTNDISIDSYIMGVSGMFNFGPAFVGAQFQYGQNLGNARWSGGQGQTTAQWDGDDDTNDVVSYGGILIAGMKVSDMLSFEGGIGYIVDDPNEAPNNFDEKDKAYNVYLMSTIALAPGVYIVPEVGYQEFGNNPEDDDKGNRFYLGAKWQIDF